jgi:RNA polymerase sigma-70 factor (ECF subfamily)
VYSEAKRILRDEGAAEEILQDLFYQIWQTASRFDPQRGSLPGWLVVVARNRAISKARRKSGKGEELHENAIDLRVDLESSSTQNLLLEKVRTVLSGLPDGQRAAVEFAYFEGMSHSEIAEKTGEPLGTIKTRIRSAMETLKKVLN